MLFSTNTASLLPPFSSCPPTRFSSSFLFLVGHTCALTLHSLSFHQLSFIFIHSHIHIHTATMTATDLDIQAVELPGTRRPGQTGMSAHTFYVFFTTQHTDGS